MRSLILSLALVGLSMAAAAQDDEAAQRQRIKAQRAEAESIFAAQEKACYARFAVNDCLDTARAQRRQALAELRRQEITLNDAERQRKSAERLRAIEERAAAAQRLPQAPMPAEPASGPSKGTLRPAPAAPRQDLGTRQDQGQQKKTKSAVSGPESADAAARNRARHEERLAQAQERKARLAKKNADRKKSAAPLPIQP